MKIRREVKGRIQMESVRKDSEELELSIPKYQCAIAVWKESGLEVIGSAVRYPHDVLVGPDHVLTDEIIGKVAVGRQGKVDLAGHERIPLGSDLVMIRLSNKEFATLGLTEAKVGIVPTRGALVTITSAAGMGTTGVLRPDRDIFGVLNYEATTLPGYSGSSYNCGPETLGVHQFGGRVNGGVAASYVYAMIRHTLKIKFEASEDWLLGEYKAGKRIKYTVMGLDEVMIDTNGRFTVVDRVSMNKAFGTEWENVFGYIDVKHKRNYEDTVPEAADSGEEDNLSTPGASGVLAESRVLDQTLYQNLMEEFKRLSKRRPRVARKLLKELQEPQPSTSGLPPPPKN